MEEEGVKMNITARAADILYTRHANDLRQVQRGPKESLTLEFETRLAADD